MPEDGEIDEEERDSISAGAWSRAPDRMREVVQTSGSHFKGVAQPTHQKGEREKRNKGPSHGKWTAVPKH